jgi:hypothetical protein
VKRIEDLDTVQDALRDSLGQLEAEQEALRKKLERKQK